MGKGQDLSLSERYKFKVGGCSLRDADRVAKSMRATKRDEFSWAVPGAESVRGGKERRVRVLAPSS